MNRSLLFDMLYKNFIQFIQLVGAVVIGIKAADALASVFNFETDHITFTPFVFFSFMIARVLILSLVDYRASKKEEEIVD